MSIRKRKWKTPEGVEQTAWVVNYTDQAGKRRLKTFDKRKSADDFDANTRNEVRTGVHTSDSSSITVGEAGDRWIAACENAGLERTSVDAYRSHLTLHIKPFLGGRKLSQLTVAMVTDFERRLRNGTDTEKARSPAMVKPSLPNSMNPRGRFLSRKLDLMCSKETSTAVGISCSTFSIKQKHTAI
jgi:integrase